MSLPVVQRWRALLQQLDSSAPLRDMRLYIKPRLSSTDQVVRTLRANPAACKKCLLIGARGGGKSTELRAIREVLRKDNFLLAEVDLDESRIHAASVSAFDLLYISSLALLKLVPDEQERRQHFEELADRYAGGNTDLKRGLGDWHAALEGVSGFATVAATAAAATGLAAGAVPAVGAIAAMAGKGLRLLPNKQVVQEDSHEGRSLQEAAARVASTVRRHHGGRPLCVLVDGLEKMNGEAAERFKEVFVETGLLANTAWAAVMAAPPCTLAEANGVHTHGIKTFPVYGFGPDNLDQLEKILELRFKEAGLDPHHDIIPEGIKKVVRRSGGLPRHALAMMETAAELAFDDQSPILSEKQIDWGIRELGRELGQGLTREHWLALVNVWKVGMLSGNKATTLFANNMILVYPPETEESTRSRFVVHPLLVKDVERVAEEESNRE
jgi:type II secretory pathway predicted ATPase ExeA